MTWFDRFCSEIAEITGNLPKDMPFKERKQILQQAAKSSGYRGHSYLYKCWRKAQKAYLSHFLNETYKSHQDVPGKKLTPIEEVIQHSYKLVD